LGRYLNYINVIWCYYIYSYVINVIDCGSYVNMGIEMEHNLFYEYYEALGE
jgi:hypothetical protein